MSDKADANATTKRLTVLEREVATLKTTLTRIQKAVEDALNEADEDDGVTPKEEDA